MKMPETKTTRKRGWPSCLVDSNKLQALLTTKGRSIRWLWSGDGPGRIDLKTGMRVEQSKPISIRTIFKIASRLECDPRQLVSDSDAKMIVETARGQITINDLDGLWGGNPGRGYTTEELKKDDYRRENPRFWADSEFEFEGFSSQNYIPVDYYPPEERWNVAFALDFTSWTTIATKSNAYELTSLLARHARRPECDLDKQIISLNIEPLVLVHDVDAHKDVTKRLVELFSLTQEIVGNQRTLPTISEIEGHEKIRSEVQDHLNWFSTRNIQILDTSLSTDFVLILDEGQEVFASFARPLLILAPTTLIDVEVEYLRLCLQHGQLDQS